jgi:hypothetical protein
MLGSVCRCACGRHKLESTWWVAGTVIPGTRLSLWEALEILPKDVSVPPNDITPTGVSVPPKDVSPKS